MKNDFKNWKPPKWHSDWGDPDIEFLLLKNFSIKAADILPILNFKLNPSEEGYLCVDIFKIDIKIAELHITNVDINQFGLFSFQDEGSEMHFTDSAEGISFLSELL